MKKFNSKQELVEAKAQAQHLANLLRGGVFCADTKTRISSIENERKAAASKVKFVGYAPQMYGMQKAGWIIEGFGFSA